MWSTLKSYFWWTHPRGSLPYDVMVTLILAFIFITPRFVDFHDKPAYMVRIMSVKDPNAGTDVYLINADQIHTTDKAELDAKFSRLLFGKVDHWEPLRDDQGNIAAYRVFVSRAARK